MTTDPSDTSSNGHRILEMNGNQSFSSKIDTKKVENSGKRGDFREDIALLRGLAILAVLGYHFWPSIFPLGFIGVDVFFVISGYLIMSTLTRSKGRAHVLVIDFYYRRFKRICPLFYLVFFLTGLCAMFVYTPVWAERYLSYYLESVLFVLNLKMLKTDGDYFAEATDEMPFLHSWSLAVEIQFYLVAPLIFFVSKLRIQVLSIGPLLMASILISSLIFQYTSSPIIAFYHPYSRLWQFLIGMLAAFYSNKSDRDSNNERMNIVSSLLISSVLIIFFPFIDRLPSPNFPQMLVTVTSGGFMLAASFGSIDWSRFRLGYTASISYSLYLVHFPVLRFSEYLAELNDLTIGAHPIALILTVIISISFHHFYEKPQMGEGRGVIFKDSLKYLALSILIALKWQAVVHPECGKQNEPPSNDLKKTSSIQSSAMPENARFVSTLYTLEGGAFVADAFGGKTPFGHYQYKNGTGQHRVVIVGNSWATQQAHIVRKILPDSYTRTMDLFSNAGNAIVFQYVPREGKNAIENQKITAELTEHFWEFVEKTKPDIVFVLMRYHYKAGDLSPFNDRRNDKVYRHYLDGVKRLSKFASHIFIETHQPFLCPLYNPDFLNRFIDMLSKGKDLEKAYQPFDAAAFDSSPVQQRLKALQEECPKCHLLNLAEPFIDRKRQRVITFDATTMLSYYDNGCHLTASGLKMIEKPFRGVVESVLGLGKE